MPTPASTPIPCLAALLPLLFSFACVSLTPFASAYRSRLAIEGVLDAYAGLSAPLPPAGPPIDLSTIQKPSLWIWGVEDRTVKIQAGRAAAARMAGSTFVALERSGHSPMEEKPDEVVRAILSFFETQPGAR